MIRGAFSSRELIRKTDFETVSSEKKEAVKTQVKAPEPFEKNRLKEFIKKTQTDRLYNEDDGAFRDKLKEENSSYIINRETDTVIINQEEKNKEAESVKYDTDEADKGSPVKASGAEETDKTQETAGIKGSVKTEKPVQLDFFEEKIFTRKASDEYVYIGQLFETYWLIQYKDTFMMIDQHAAHEKILYEKLVRSLKERKINSQIINPPIVLSLNQKEELLLRSHIEQFKELGFDIEHFGGKEYAVYSVPDNLVPIAEHELLMELIDTLEENSDRLTDELILEKAASMSCKAAVKGNTKLSLIEAKALINELLSLENPYACPHGRPTIISMTKRDIEKKFKRIV